MGVAEEPIGVVDEPAGVADEARGFAGDVDSLAPELESSVDSPAVPAMPPEDAESSFLDPSASGPFPGAFIDEEPDTRPPEPAPVLPAPPEPTVPEPAIPEPAIPEPTAAAEEVPPTPSDDDVSRLLDSLDSARVDDALLGAPPDLAALAADPPPPVVAEPSADASSAPRPDSPSEDLIVDAPSAQAPTEEPMAPEVVEASDSPPAILPELEAIPPGFEPSGDVPSPPPESPARVRVVVRDPVTRTVPAPGADIVPPPAPVDPPLAAGSPQVLADEVVAPSGRTSAPVSTPADRLPVIPMKPGTTRPRRARKAAPAGWARCCSPRWALSGPSSAGSSIPSLASSEASPSSMTRRRRSWGRPSKSSGPRPPDGPAESVRVPPRSRRVPVSRGPTPLIPRPGVRRSTRRRRRAWRRRCRPSPPRSRPGSEPSPTASAAWPPPVATRNPRPRVWISLRLRRPHVKTRGRRSRRFPSRWSPWPIRSRPTRARRPIPRVGSRPPWCSSRPHHRPRLPRRG